jgi:hydrogenase maturation protease
VLGLGNPILTDDGVGIHTVRAVQARIDGRSGGGQSQGIAFAEAGVGGLRLLEVIAGYDRVILLDAIQTPDGRPGDIYLLSLAESHGVGGGDMRSSLHRNCSGTLHAGSTHDLTLPGALAWGREAGMTLPADEAIQIVAIEGQEVLTFGENCTKAVAAAIPRAVGLVLGMLGRNWKPEAGS